jgi:Mrp family chromosome partitioning ATPase
MTVVAWVVPAGTSGCTTSSLVAASSLPEGQPVVFAECDASGGDLAAWAELGETPGWATAIAGGDRSWAGLCTHFQQLPSGLSVLCAPTRARMARGVVGEAAARFGPALGSMADVLVVADCGRVGGDQLPAWVAPASLVLLLVRQAPSSVGATVARVDRAGEALERLAAGSAPVGVVVVGSRPYDPAELVAAIGGELFGVLPEDPIGAGLASGAWTVGRGASRSALARAARPLGARLAELLAAGASVVRLEPRSGAAG